MGKSLSSSEDGAMPELIWPEQVDRHFNWPVGTAARLARRRRLPHYLLPDGSVRMCLEEVQALVRHIPLRTEEVQNAPS
jgi:hypothetical protein